MSLKKNTHTGAGVFSLLSHQDVKQLASPQQEVCSDVDTMWPAHGKYTTATSGTIGCYPGLNTHKQKQHTNNS